MTNNTPEEETSEETRPETLVAPEPASSADEDTQSVEVAENAAPDAQVLRHEAEQQVIALLTSLSDQLKETNRISRERESVIDRLHQENQRLKQGELQQAQLPILRDLIRLYDDLKLTAASYSDRATADGEKFVNDLRCYAETVADILYRHGVEKIEAATGEEFNSKEHKAVAVTHAAGPEQERRIARVIRDGFRNETRVIRSVEVEVLRYEAPPDGAHAPDATAPQDEVGNQPETT